MRLKTGAVHCMSRCDELSATCTVSRQPHNLPVRTSDPKLQTIATLLICLQANARALVVKSEWTRNEARRGGGSYIDGVARFVDVNVTDCHARNWAGAFYPAPKTGNIEFVRIRVVGCTADFGAAALCVAGGTGGAGGTGSNMTTSITDSAFYNCTALSNNAGFAYVFQDADFVMSNSLISGCTSPTKGGALFATSARLRCGTYQPTHLPKRSFLSTPS